MMIGQRARCSLESEQDRIVEDLIGTLDCRYARGSAELRLGVASSSAYFTRVASAGRRRPGTVAPEPRPCSVGFVDMSGFTTLTRHGPDEAELRDRARASSSRWPPTSSAAHGGRRSSRRSVTRCCSLVDAARRRRGGSRSSDDRRRGEGDERPAVVAGRRGVRAGGQPARRRLRLPPSTSPAG